MLLAILLVISLLTLFVLTFFSHFTLSYINNRDTGNAGGTVINKKLFDFIGADRIQGHGVSTGRGMSRGVHGPAVVLNTISLTYQLYDVPMVIEINDATVVDNDQPFGLLISVKDIARIENAFGYHMEDYEFKKDDLVGSPTWKIDEKDVERQKLLDEEFDTKLTKKRHDAEEANKKDKEYRILRNKQRKRATKRKKAKKTNTAAESQEKVRYSEHYRYSNCRYPNLRNFRSTERNNSKKPIPVVVDTWVVAIGVLGLAAAAYVLSNEPGPGRPSHRIMAPRETSFEILLTSLTKLA